MTVLPDTNSILRYLLKDDEKHYNAAEKFFEKVRNGGERALILESVLVECVYVLVRFYKVPRKETTEKLQSLLHYKGIENIDKDELIYALKIHGEKNIDITDCILHSKIKNNPRRKLFSFDEKLLKLK